ncbi:transglycosylase SLT domain-containing protein [Sinimarinibacterium thermocellulolyticum]|uniref:Transglycosylase SLT domain-containing protein n=1 Tax=Sinimarinibacterium thermocellulolyticum TaxID=3170016 RepID=A0ABV2AAR3_9GAMM
MGRRLTATLAWCALCAPLPASASFAAGDSIWPRIVANLRLVNDEQPQIVTCAQRYAKHADATRRLLARSQPFLWHIVETVERYDLPAELALLPAVESGFDPHAASSQQALGLWQLLPSTGRSLGLKTTAHYDARRDPLASTDAALRHLRALYAHFSDWRLALAAYNLGQSRLSRLLDAHPRGTDFWDLRLPRETSEHVCRVMALALLVEQPGRFGIRLPDIPDTPAAEQIPLHGPVDLARAAKLAGVPEAVIRVYNPGLDDLGDTAGKSVLLLPSAHARRLRASLAKVDDPARFAQTSRAAVPSTQVHVVQPGETLWRIARRYQTSVDALMRHNNLVPASQIRPGHRLRVPSQTAS